MLKFIKFGALWLCKDCFMYLMNLINPVLLIVCFFIVHFDFFYHQLFHNLFFLHIVYGTYCWYAVRMVLGCIVLYTLRFLRHQVCTFASFSLFLIISNDNQQRRPILSKWFNFSLNLSYVLSKIFDVLPI